MTSDQIALLACACASIAVTVGLIIGHAHESSNARHMERVEEVTREWKAIDRKKHPRNSRGQFEAKAKS